MPSGDEGIADEPSGDFLQLRRASVASLETDENTLLLRDIFSQLHELRIASGLAPAGSMPVPGAIVHTPPEVSPRPSVEVAAAPAPALTGAPCISVGAPSPPPPIAAPNGNAAGKQPAAAPSPSEASGASPSVPATKLKSALRRASDDVKAARDEPQEDFTGLVNASLRGRERAARDDRPGGALPRHVGSVDARAAAVRLRRVADGDLLLRLPEEYGDLGGQHLDRYLVHR